MYSGQLSSRACLLCVRMLPGHSRLYTTTLHLCTVDALHAPRKQKCVARTNATQQQRTMRDSFEPSVGWDERVPSSSAHVGHHGDQRGCRKRRRRQPRKCTKRGAPPSSVDGDEKKSWFTDRQLLKRHAHADRVRCRPPRRRTLLGYTGAYASASASAAAAARSARPAWLATRVMRRAMRAASPSATSMESSRAQCSW